MGLVLVPPIIKPVHAAGDCAKVPVATWAPFLNNLEGVVVPVKEKEHSCVDESIMVLAGAVNRAEALVPQYTVPLAAP